MTRFFKDQVTDFIIFEISLYPGLQSFIRY